MDLWTTPQPLPRYFGWAAYGVFVALIAVGVAYELPDDDPGRVWAAAAGAVVFGAVTLLGPRWATPFAAATAGVAVIGVCVGDPGNVGWFALVLLIAWCVAIIPLGITLLFWAGTVVMFLLEATVTSSDPGWYAWTAGTTFGLVVCILALRQHDLVVQLRAAQEGLTRRAQAEERTRIARELHDVIAHSLTVSLMHVSSARLALADAPDEAARALEEAERLGRASLDEVRHAVGTLHREGAADPTAPLPGSTDVPALIDSFKIGRAHV